MHRPATVTTRLIGGQAYRVAHWQATGPATGRPLLFFTGIGASLELLTPFLERLTGRDVVTFDPPGIGGSPLCRWPYRPRNIARAADRIMRELGYSGEIDVMGVSWGGLMAQEFAHRYGGRVGSLVLAATTAGVAMVPGKWSALKEMARPRRHVDPSYMVRHKHEMYGGRTDGLASIWAQTLPPTRRGYLYQLLAIWGWTSAWYLRRLAPRTLILMGEEDRLVPMANGRFLQRMIPNSRLETISDGGHLFLLTHREGMAARVEEYLDDTSS